LHNTKMKN